jgi:HEPN domain-containing protein
MSTELDLARGWLIKAASDLAAGRLVVEGDGPYDTACFHAQQAIEKSLKGFLVLRKQAAPRTHDLEELQRLCLSLAPLPGLADLDLVEAADYGVMARYDLDFWPEQTTATDALILAEDVFQIVVATLPPAYRPKQPDQVPYL